MCASPDCPPLFIIGTWFNKDLEYQDEPAGDIDRLKERWTRRFTTVLEKEVLGSLGDADHWFNQWTPDASAFRNIYMLRDFKYSRAIYGGYDPRIGTPEAGEPLRPAAYPNFFADLRATFVDHEFVRLHFADPARSWEDAAAVASDGTRRIIGRLSLLAPRVAQARDERCAAEVAAAVRELKSLLSRHYHPEGSEEKIRQAKRQAGSACREIDSMVGRDAYAFGRLLDTMMVGEGELYALIHDHMLGERQTEPVSDEESRIFMSAGLDSHVSRKENIERLCDYLGVDTEEECRDELRPADLDRLLSLGQMAGGRADTLVDAVLEFWNEHILMGRVVNAFEDALPAISGIMAQMWTLARLLPLRQQLIERTRRLMDEVDTETAVPRLADCLAMELGAFAASFGYALYPAAERQRLLELNQRLRLGIEPSVINAPEAPGMALLSDLSQAHERLSAGGFGAADRQLLARFPQYGRLWRWQQQMRAGFAFATELPDYDVQANERLGQIISQINNA